MAEKDVTPRPVPPLPEGADPNQPETMFEDFRVATYGSGTLAKVTQRGFSRAKKVVSNLFSDVDEVVDFDPKMFFFLDQS